MRETIETELGTEIQCAQCKDFWPADKEFFYGATGGGLHSWCKACYRANPKVKARKQRWLDSEKARRVDAAALPALQEAA